MYCRQNIKKTRPVDPSKKGTSNVLQCIASQKVKEETYFEECGGPVKPEITFFGESLPKKFMDVFEKIDSECDLLIVIGTALAVTPFASIVGMVNENTPKVLINMTPVDRYDF